MTKSEVLAAKKQNRPVYFQENWTENIVEAKIVDIVVSEGSKESAYAQLHCIRLPELDIKHGGDIGQKFEDLYPSVRSLRDHIQREENRRIQEISDSIHTRDDLIQFMFDHTVACCEEYTDWTAREAVKQIAKTKFGIDLGD